MIYPDNIHSGQKWAVCNRAVEQFREEHNAHPASALFASARSLLDASIPDKYHNQRIVWLSTYWSKVLPDIPEENKDEATIRMQGAMSLYRDFNKYQREDFEPTVNRILRDRDIVEKECEKDTFHGNPKIADFITNGLPSKNPNSNSASNITYIKRLLVNPDNAGMTEEERETILNAKTEIEKQSYDDSYWDKDINLNDLRLNISSSMPPDPPEDYTGYTEIDPNGRYAVTSNNIDVTGLRRNEDAWVVNDKGINHFDEDFEHLVDCETASFSHNALFFPWMIANAINDWNGLLSDSGEDFLSVMMVGSGVTLIIRLHECIGTSLISSQYVVAVNTPYYLKLKRNESIGSYGQLQCSIYSDVDRISLLIALSLTLRAKNDFRYVYGMNSGNNGSTPSITGSVSNLDLQEPVAIIFSRARMINMEGTLGGLTKSTLNNLGGV